MIKSFKETKKETSHVWAQFRSLGGSQCHSQKNFLNYSKWKEGHENLQLPLLSFKNIATSQYAKL